MDIEAWIMQSSNKQRSVQAREHLLNDHCEMGIRDAGVYATTRTELRHHGLVPRGTLLSLSLSLWLWIHIFWVVSLVEKIEKKTKASKRLVASKESERKLRRKPKKTKEKSKKQKAKGRRHTKHNQKKKEDVKI